MGKYSDLEKINPSSAEFFKDYNGGKIYTDDCGFVAVKRNYIIDDAVYELADARDLIDNFNIK